MKESKTPAWSWLAGALWLAVFPLWQGMSYSNITRTKWEGMLALSAVTLVLALCTALVQKEVVIRPLLPRALAIGYFAWLGLSAVFGLWSHAVNASGQMAVWMGAIRYEGMATQLCYGLIFLCMSMLPVNRRWVLHGASLALAVFAGVVALQYMGQNPLGLFPAGRSTRTNYEFQGTIGNIDMVSGYLSLVVPLLLGGYVLAEKRCLPWLAAGSLGVLLSLCMEVQSGLIAMVLLALVLVMLFLHCPARRARCLQALACMLLALGLRPCMHLPWLDGGKTLFFTLTAPGVAAMLAGMVLLLAARLKTLAQWKPLSGKMLLGLFAGVVVLGLLAVAALPVPPSMGGLWELHEVLCGRWQDGFGSGRLGVWRYTVDMAKESLLFGNGPDTFFYAMQHYLAEHDFTLRENFDNPHNEYLAILVNSGLPALMLYLGLLAAVLVRCAKGGREQPLLWAWGMAVLCFMAQGFFSFSICLVSPMFWAVLGMCCRRDQR